MTARSSVFLLAGAYTDLLVVNSLDVVTHALLTIRAVKRYLIRIDCALNGKYAALVALLAGFYVFLYQVNALDDNLSFFGGYLKDFTDLSLEVTSLVTGKNYDGIALLYMKCIHLNRYLLKELRERAKGFL